jgi:hypothetical protein
MVRTIKPFVELEMSNDTQLLIDVGNIRDDIESFWTLNMS